MSSTLLNARARVAALSRSRDENDPKLLDAKLDLAEAKLTRTFEQVIAAAPPLRPEQIDRLHRILDGGAA